MCKKSADGARPWLEPRARLAAAGSVSRRPCLGTASELRSTLRLCARYLLGQTRAALSRETRRAARGTDQCRSRRYTSKNDAAAESSYKRCILVSPRRLPPRLTCSASEVWLSGAHACGACLPLCWQTAQRTTAHEGVPPKSGPRSFANPHRVTSPRPSRFVVTHRTSLCECVTRQIVSVRWTSSRGIVVNKQCDFHGKRRFIDNPFIRLAGKSSSSVVRSRSTSQNPVFAKLSPLAIGSS